MGIYQKTSWLLSLPQLIKIKFSCKLSLVWGHCLTLIWVRRGSVPSTSFFFLFKSMYFLIWNGNSKKVYSQFCSDVLSTKQDACIYLAQSKLCSTYFHFAWMQISCFFSVCGKKLHSILWDQLWVCRLRERKTRSLWIQMVTQLLSAFLQLTHPFISQRTAIPANDTRYSNILTTGFYCYFLWIPYNWFTKPPLQLSENYCFAT